MGAETWTPGAVDSAGAGAGAEFEFGGREGRGAVETDPLLGAGTGT